MNHLQNEKSPYLRQHRHQPVDWYPWGDEAFSKAKAENKPVLLSIGYSTCHWCHVMAHESFEDEEVAKKMNRDFIAIKLDREERPDIDSIYMKVCQGLTGSGGWPLTILMTPDQHPFFAATYLPTAPFLNLLDKVSQKWKEDSSGLRSTGRQIVDWLQTIQEESKDDAPALETVSRQAYRWFQSTYDKKWGGFGRAPKFPSAHNLLFLLQMAELVLDAAGKADQLSGSAMVHHTLRCMAQGGMYDHLGGGFSRYSTDEKWLVPHFEKTLYDNALLAMAYSEAGYGSVACEILDYALRELTHPEGGFYCGQDADSDGEEGKFYLWTEDEIKKVLGKEKGEEFCYAYQIEPSGIPNRIGQPWNEESPMKEEKQILTEYRKERCELGLDDKILTSWNGLMMAAMAVVGRQQNRIDYILAAEKATGFTRVHLTRSSGRLWHRFSDGETAHMGQLSDYAYYAYGLLELFRSTQKADYLLQAVQTAQWMEMLFADEAKGGYYETAKDSEGLVYFYHIAHMAKHFAVGGCGVRAFLDIWVMNHKMSFDREKRYKLLEEGGLLQFAKAAESVSEVWFAGAEPTKMDIAVSDYILRASLYGDKANRAALGQARSGGKLKYLLTQRVFMPYAFLKDEYPVLKERKWLMPYYQVVRWCKMLRRRGGLNNTVKELKANAASKQSDGNAAADILKHLGL